MSENNTASSGNFYASSREIRKSFDEFKERKEFLENVNKRFETVEEINNIITKSVKDSGKIGSETLPKDEEITPAIKAATGQSGLGTLKKDTEKDEYLEQLKEEARKLHEEAHKIYAEYKKMDKGSASDEFTVMVEKFRARIKKALEHLDKFEEALNIDRAIQNYGRQSSPDNKNTNIAGSGPVSLRETEQALNKGNEPSSNNETRISGSSVAPYGADNTASGNNTLKANAQPVPNTNESSRREQISNNGRE